MLGGGSKKENKATSFVQFGGGTLPRAVGGGLWLLWGNDSCVRVLEMCQNFIVAEVDHKDGKGSWILVGIYGDPGRSMNPAIWADLEQYTRDCGEPIMIVGDFNAIASAEEKWGGSQVLSTANRSFRDWMNSQGLIDLGHNGPAYTWCNKRQRHLNISQRLDRGIASLA